MVQGISGIDQSKLGGPDKLDGDKQKKVKELVDKVLNHLKDMLASKPSSVSDIKNMIEMLKELDPAAAAKAEELLNKMEHELSSKGVNLTEDEKIKKMQEMVMAAQAGQLGVFGVNNDNQGQTASKQDDKKIPGSISVSI